MPGWVKVVEFHKVPSAGGMRVEVGELALAVFNLDGQLYALEDTCPRDGGSLSQGDLFGDLVQCPVEACKYELATGQCITFDAQVETFEVRREGADVQVKLD